MKKKRVSIIMSAYNSKDFIKEAVDSVLNQQGDFKLDLYVGIDGCKETLNEIKGYSNKINLYYSKENVGTYIIKNSLFNKIDDKSSIIVTFDSDDIMPLNFLAYYVERYQEGIIRLSGKNIKEGKQVGLCSPEGTIITTYEIFSKLGGYNSFRVGQDTDFIRRARKLKISQKRLQDAPRFIRRIHDNSLTQNSDTGFRSQYRRDIVNKNNNLIKEKKFVADMETVELLKINESYNDLGDIN